MSVLIEVDKLTKSFGPFIAVDNISFSLDIKIILRTIKKVLKSEGISSATSVTMEGFKGNN